MSSVDMESDPKVGLPARHLEFGHNACPRLSTTGADKTLNSGGPNDFAGYAQQWSDVYGAVHRMLHKNDELARHVRLVYFEKLCRNPQEEFASILAFTNLSRPGAVDKLSEGIQLPAGPDRFDVEPFASSWRIVAEVAGRFGYRKDPHDLGTLAGLENE
jgi:hypothetical protein